MKPGRIYEICWVDCMTDEDWIDRELIDKVIDEKIERLFTYTGYFIKERKGYYVFTSGNCEHESYFNVAIFPKKCVIKRKLLK